LEHVVVVAVAVAVLPDAVDATGVVAGVTTVQNKQSNNHEKDQFASTYQEKFGKIVWLFGRHLLYTCAYNDNHLWQL